MIECTTTSNATFNATKRISESAAEIVRARTPTYVPPRLVKSAGKHKALSPKKAVTKRSENPIKKFTRTDSSTNSTTNYKSKSTCTTFESKQTNKSNTRSKSTGIIRSKQPRAGPKPDQAGTECFDDCTSLDWNEDTFTEPNEVDDERDDFDPESSKTYWTIQSIYQGGQEVVLFPLCKYDTNTTINELLEVLEDIKGERENIIIKKRVISDRNSMMFFKFGPRAVEFNAVRGAFRRAGFGRLKRDDENCKFDTFNSMWSKHLPNQDFGKLKEFQKVNHFPGSFELGRKDTLHRTMGKMRDRHGLEYDFYPKSYSWPESQNELNMDISNSNGKNLYIVKPKASSCGRGIKVINKLSQVKCKDCIIQRYIPNPLLIDNKKFDLRIYVGVTDFHPLKIYMFQEGLVSSNKDIKDKYAHLTNYSINKHSDTFETSEEGDAGSKWTISALKKYFKDNKVDDSMLWRGIEDIIIKTIISADDTVNSMMARTIKSKKNVCYEVFGFDILVDDYLKPWLLEVNVSPSLSSSSAMDRKIKTRLIANLMNLVGFEVCDRRKLKDDAKKQADANLFYKSHAKVKRSIHQLKEVTSQQLNNYMTPCEMKVCQELDDEHRRRGMFTRLFPCKDTKYNKYFVNERYKNVLVQKWIQNKM
ncbi:tubulin polyglutamylase [Acrasis kona]|uniref:Tubulin--tyrosine ligase-like protein 5 n=1 Tax=Acrasis kona TaxID=1008807 RepID=A0AAW2YKL1_9EUKA